MRRSASLICSSATLEYSASMAAAQRRYSSSDSKSALERPPRSLSSVGEQLSVSSCTHGLTYGLFRLFQGLGVPLRFRNGHPSFKFRLPARRPRLMYYLLL